MPARRLPANGEVLRWARIHRGFELQDAARLLQITPEELATIEDRNELVPTQVFNRMLRTYEMSESVLFLPNPPPVRPIPADFRTPLGTNPKLLPKTRKTIQDTWEFIEEATSLLFEDGVVPRVLGSVAAASVDDNPEAIASLHREFLGVSFEQQVAWKLGEAFDGWRVAFDARGVLVLLKNMPWLDCRGFLLWSTDLLPAIVVNSQDKPNSRLFTLFHEYAHLVLRQPAACVLVEADVSHKATEDWCNDFAGSFLMPRERIEALVDKKVRIKPMKEWAVGDYRALGGQFRVSAMAIARRLKALYGDTFYESGFALLKGSEQKLQRDNQERGPLPAVVKLAEVGKSMALRVELALSSHDISNREASELLGLSLGQLDMFREKVAI